MAKPSKRTIVATAWDTTGKEALKPPERIAIEQVSEGEESEVERSTQASVSTKITQPPSLNGNDVVSSRGSIRDRGPPITTSSPLESVSRKPSVRETRQEKIGRGERVVPYGIDISPPVPTVPTRTKAARIPPPVTQRLPPHHRKDDGPTSSAGPVDDVNKPPSNNGMIP